MKRLKFFFVVWCYSTGLADTVTAGTELVLVVIDLLCILSFLQHGMIFKNSFLNFSPKIQYRIPLMLWLIYTMVIIKRLPKG